ncbi:cAMP-dependent protein kinase catalytic subunit beta-like [Nilaparvata lugens]|uniref:cAMP-dependent protein kinase catalytic subunit beta-like n=1 Tax=Nilaparvata lugens TaxID=108931 RepID=UPI00193CCD9D|nr:cAMP-dependent protein kinase catalytic subunit beta-like [Nilaparvata lugens]XP_039275514.1 cAMP-dependent protein kinase catalytic subunit beta-like [Nilaparvata lugens]XP_039275515.1 cAMP-dependent protein kinase catalytic subunit beta-like [Nilaparvata lugens]XP_039280053.1 cAMP-dependent protein kinase catalytic subunit beta-like [Nilaparvata lugens]
MSFDRQIKDFQEFLIREKRAFNGKFRKPIQYKIDIDDFEALKTVAKGTFSKFVLAKIVSSHEVCALKICPKKTLVKYRQVEHTRDEKHVLEVIKFPFVVRLLYFFQDNRNLYFALSFVKGIEFNNRLKQLKKFSEDSARFYSAQIVLTLEYLHYLDLIYRNIKPESLVIGNNGYLKLIDFKFCKYIDEKKERTYTICGGPEYLAPEVILSRGYGKSCDYWSLGVIIYEMCCGIPPFTAKDHVKLYEKIIAGKYKMPAAFSKDLNNLIHKLLQIEVPKRIGCLKRGMDDVKAHNWFSTIDWDMVLNRQESPPYLPQKFDDPSKDIREYSSPLDLQTSQNDIFAEEFYDF